MSTEREREGETETERGVCKTWTNQILVWISLLLPDQMVPFIPACPLTALFDNINFLVKVSLSGRPPTVVLETIRLQVHPDFNLRRLAVGDALLG